MPAMERSGTRLVGGLCLFGPASAAAQVVNIRAVRRRLEGQNKRVGHLERKEKTEKTDL